MKRPARNLYTAADIKLIGGLAHPERIQVGRRNEIRTRSRPFGPKNARDSALELKTGWPFQFRPASHMVAEQACRSYSI